MAVKTIDPRKRRIRSVTLWGALLNVVLMALKIASGIFIRSSSLVADGVHSFSDLATDFAVLLGTRISDKPPDETHPYGHRRFETLASQFIATVLFVVSIGFIWSAGISIYSHEHNYPGFLILVIAGISVIAKEIIFHITRRISRETGSSALYANAWHHRSDSLSSVAVLLGGVASLFGWGQADHIATIIVGFMIMGVAGKIFYECLIELSEQSADKESIRKIESILAEDNDISNWHALRTRRLGGELSVDVHILVDPDLSVLKSHEISVRIENRVREELSKPVNILIHIEPNI